MMNLYARLLAALGLAFSVAAALALIWLAAGGMPQAVAASDMLQTAAGTLAGRAGLGLAGVALIFLIAFLAMKALGYGANKVLSFQTSSGRMEVDISALEDCLNRTMLEMDDVLEARSSISHSSSISKPVNLRLSVVLAERADVPGKGAAISARVSDRFLQIIPIETKPKVDLSVRIRSPKNAPVRKPEPEPLPAPPAVARSSQPDEVEDATEVAEAPEALDESSGEAGEIEGDAGSPEGDFGDDEEPGGETAEDEVDELEDELGDELEGELEDELEDVPDFTGERRYTSDDNA